MCDVQLNPPVTHDTLFGGALRCDQPVQGYRFSLDAVLAAQFVLPGADDRVLDLGCGCGIIGLILAYRVPGVRVHGLELQPELAELARHNITLNGFTTRMAILQGDAREISQAVRAEDYQLVVCNPPYGAPHGGRISQHAQAATARHEAHGTLADFVRAAAFAVCNRGRVVFVYPARRAPELVQTLMDNRLVPKRMLPVYAYPGAGAARLLLVEAVKNGGAQCAIEEPLYIHATSGGAYSEAMQQFYQENTCSPK